MSFEKLLDEKLRLAHQIKAHGNKQDTWNAEDRLQWDRLNAAYDAVDSQLDTRRNPRIGRDGGSITDGPRNAEAFGGRNVDALDEALSGWTLNQLGEPISDYHVSACARYGVSPMSNTFNVRLPNQAPTAGGSWNFAARNSLGRTDGTAGGFTTTTGFMARLEKALKDYSGVMRAGEIWITTDGNPVAWPTTDDSGNVGALVGENTDVSTGTDPTFGATTFGSYKITSRVVKISHELIRDSALNIAGVIADLLGERVGRKANQLFTTGTGATQPFGIVTQATVGKTTTGATAITFDELIDLEHSVDPAYRDRAKGCGFMLHDSLTAYLRKLKDGNGNYLWQPSATLGAPDTLNGWPVFTNQDMQSSVATGTRTVLFGAFASYKVRLVGEVRIKRLIERYADYDQEGFIAFLSMDGALLDAGTNPVKALLQA